MKRRLSAKQKERKRYLEARDIYSEPASAFLGSMRVLEHECDLVDDVMDLWLWDQAATWGCTVGVTGGIVPIVWRGRKKRPANDNGRES